MNSEAKQPFIDAVPGRHSGDLCFAGTRVPVSTLFEFLAGGDSLGAFLAAFPSVGTEQARFALREAPIGMGFEEQTVADAPPPAYQFADLRQGRSLEGFFRHCPGVTQEQAESLSAPRPPSSNEITACLTGRTQRYRRWCLGVDCPRRRGVAARRSRWARSGRAAHGRQAVGGRSASRRRQALRLRRSKRTANNSRNHLQASWATTESPPSAAIVVWCRAGRVGLCRACSHDAGDG